MRETNRHLQPMIEEAHSAQQLADTAQSTAADIGKQFEEAKAVADSAISRVDYLRMATHRAAFAIAAQGRERIFDKQLADYAQAVFELNGKSPEVAARQAALLGGLSTSKFAVPVLLGPNLLGLFGGDTGGDIATTPDGIQQNGGIWLQTSGVADTFSRYSETATWQWHDGSSPEKSESHLLTEDVVISEDPEEIASALKDKMPIVAVGEEAVVSVIDRKPHNKRDGSEAIKFVIGKKVGDIALETSTKEHKLTSAYEAELQEACTRGGIGVGVPVSAKLHPEILKLVKERKPSFSFSDRIATILEGDLDQHGVGSVLGKVYVGPAVKKRGQASNNIIGGVTKITQTYDRVLNPNGFHDHDVQASHRHTVRLIKALAAFRRERLLDQGFSRFNPRVREMKRLANYIDPMDVINIMMSDQKEACW